MYIKLIQIQCVLSAIKMYVHFVHVFALFNQMMPNVHHQFSQSKLSVTK